MFHYFELSTRSPNANRSLMKRASKKVGAVSRSEKPCVLQCFFNLLRWLWCAASQVRWARSEEHCVLQCFSTVSDDFDTQYKVKRGSKVFATQNSCYVSSETGFEAYYFEVSFARLQRTGVPRSLDATIIVHACNETGFELFYVDSLCVYPQQDGVRKPSWTQNPFEFYRFDAFWGLTRAG